MKNSTVHWGAIFAGVFIAMSSMVFFSLFALAAGIGGVNVIEPLTGTISVGEGIYAILTAMISFALSGFCTVRMAGLREPGTACLHALTTFAVAGALVPALFTRAFFVGAPGFAVAPTSSMFLSTGMAWTLFLSFAFSSIASCAGGVQACYREGMVGGVSLEEERRQRIAA